MSGGGRRTVRVLDGPEALARAAAAELAQRAARVAGSGGELAVSLSGGSTPRRLYEVLGADLPWSRIHLFWGDERHVPPDHRDSNYRMVREALLDRVAIPAGNVHRIAAEQPDAGAAAAAYEAELREFFAARGRLVQGFPRFDLVFLGMGPDGHTASLFPGSSALGERVRLVVANWVEKLGDHRITLTYPAIDAADLVVFLVTGSDKAEVLRELLEEDPDRYPAGRVRPERGELLWLVDRDAAARLTEVFNGQ